MLSRLSAVIFHNILLSNILKVYGALRLSVKILLMWNSKLQIDGGQDPVVGSSLLEGSNLVVPRVSFYFISFVFFSNLV